MDSQEVENWVLSRLAQRALGRRDHIAAGLRRLTDDIDRDEVNETGSHPYSSLASRVVSTVVGRIPNLGLDSLVEAAADADSFASDAAQGAPQG